MKEERVHKYCLSKKMKETGRALPIIWDMKLEIWLGAC